MRVVVKAGVCACLHKRLTALVQLADKQYALVVDILA